MSGWRGHTLWPSASSSPGRLHPRVTPTLQAGPALRPPPASSRASRALILPFCNGVSLCSSGRLQLTRGCSGAHSDLPPQPAGAGLHRHAGHTERPRPACGVPGPAWNPFAPGPPGGTGAPTVPVLTAHLLVWGPCGCLTSATWLRPSGDTFCCFYFFFRWGEALSGSQSARQIMRCNACPALAGSLCPA